MILQPLSGARLFDLIKVQKRRELKVTIPPKKLKDFKTLGFVWHHGKSRYKVSNIGSSLSESGLHIHVERDLSRLFTKTEVVDYYIHLGEEYMMGSVEDWGCETADDVLKRMETTSREELNQEGKDALYRNTILNEFVYYTALDDTLLITRNVDYSESLPELMHRALEAADIYPRTKRILTLDLESRLENAGNQLDIILFICVDIWNKILDASGETKD